LQRERLVDERGGGRQGAMIFDRACWICIHRSMGDQLLQSLRWLCRVFVVLVFREVVC
jgi:hypothetical protein